MTKGSSLLHRLYADSNGASAVEFALVAPMLIALYFGMAEFCQAMLANRKATHVASAVGDLVAQSDSISKTDLSNIYKIGPSIMAPFSSTLKIRVSSIKKDSTGKVSQEWTNATSPAPDTYILTNLPNPPANSTQPFLGNGQSIIVTQTEYTYISPVDFGAIRGLLIKGGSSSGPTSYTFKKTFYLRPRKSDSVTCSDC